MRYMTHCEYGETVLETPRGRGLDRTAALKAITQGRSVIYAVRLPDGIIKIGCSKSLWNRRRAWAAEILGFRFGDMREEQEIHQSLQAHVARHEVAHG